MTMSAVGVQGVTFPGRWVTLALAGVVVGAGGATELLLVVVLTAGGVGVGVGLT